MIARTDDPSQVSPETDSSSVLVNEKAVEAVALALWQDRCPDDEWSPEDRENYLGHSRAAIEAIAPFLPHAQDSVVATARRFMGWFIADTDPTALIMPEGIEPEEINEFTQAFAALQDSLTAALPFLHPDRDSVIEECLAQQPSTAENPNEDTYQRGYFDGVMAFGRAILNLKSTDAPVKGK